MRVALVTHALPQPSSNGGPMTCWAIIKTLIERGHHVTVFSLLDPTDPFSTPARQAVLTSLGVTLVPVPVSGYVGDLMGRRLNKWLQLLRPQVATFYPSAALAPRMQQLLEREEPDVIFAYHYVALAATHGLRVAPRVAGAADLWHWPSLKRWTQMKPAATRFYISFTLTTLAGLLIYPRLMAELLNDCEVKGCFGAWDAAWLRRHGVPDCRYFQSPILDACGPAWQALRDAAPARRKPKIVTAISHLGATSTSAMLHMLATQVLPRLERMLGPDGFEVHVIGEGQPPKALAKMLPRPSVILRGRVEPADPEFLSADVLLIPTPIVLGLRLRIITGMSFGCCIVAHTNEALNIPELIDGQNALMASSGAGLAEAVVRAIRDPALRRQLGVNARKTYEAHFHPSVAGNRMAVELERVAGALAPTEAMA